MTKFPELPELFYSTWGSDFYSEHWLKPLNCWMLAAIKFIEANIDLEKENALAAFEEFCGSDLMFIYPDPTQRQRVHDLFVKQYNAVATHLTFKQREIVCTYPVDPFKTLFIYVTIDKPAIKPQFIIDKISLNEEKSLQQVLLEPEIMEEAGLTIYYQFFMVPPETKFSFQVENTSCKKNFTTPAFGIPLYVVQQLKVRPKYNQTSLQEKIKAIWGQQKEDIPVIATPTKDSQSIYTKDHLESLLRGKRAAIFKYNKEFYSLLRFQNLAAYELEVVFDDKISLEDASEYAQNDAKKIPVVNDIEKIESYEFDVIILTCALNFGTEIEYFKALMQLAAKKNIPVISLYDDVLQYDLFDGRNIDERNFYRIGLPQQKDIPHELLSPENTATNVLAVFGTDTVQGKFTTQLYLREALKQHMKITHWATEPTGGLLGADIGYSRVDITMSEEQRIAFERANIKKLAETCDLIITGGQNSIIYVPPGSAKENNVSTIIFDTHLPRYIVLTVSVDTAIKQVEDSIAYVAELAAKHQITSRVVALAMMGGRKIRGSRWTETYFAPVDTATVLTAKQRLDEAFGLPLYVVPDEIDGLAKEIAMIDFINA